MQTGPINPKKDLGNKKAYIIDRHIMPSRHECGEKEKEMSAKYGSLSVEAERMWDLKAEVRPVFVGGLGAGTRNRGDNLAKIPVNQDAFMCQKIYAFFDQKRSFITY